MRFPARSLNHSARTTSVRRHPTHMHSMMAGMMLSVLMGTSATADDTEVFFGQVDRDKGSYPNVLFVLDTSGSMNWYDDGHEGTRLERMKDALQRILDSTANVNVGMMRFNGWGGGGSVIYPLTDIDERICETGDCSSVSLIYRIDDDVDDREEYLSDNTLSDGDLLSLTSPDGTREQMVGLRFHGVDIPQGATITSAKLEFTSDNNSSGTTSLDIRTEAADSSEEFANDNILSTRTLGFQEVNWAPSSWSTNSVYQSPDLSALVQEVVNRPGWCGGKALSFIIDGEGDRDAKSYNNSPSDAPALKVTYNAESIPDNGGCSRRSLVAQVAKSSDDAEEKLHNNSIQLNSPDLDIPQDQSHQMRVGLRFLDIDIPNGATIDSASLEFETEEAHTGSVSARLRAQAHDDPPAFDNNSRDITDRAQSAASVDWDDIPETSAEEKLETPDIATLVQELVNRPGWVPNNAMVFLVDKKSGSGRREYESYDSKPEAAAKLKISFSVPSGSARPPVESITAREEMKQVVSSISATGSTPVVSSFYEAAQYYLGRNVDYGKTRGHGSDKHRFHRVSVPDSYTGGTVSRDADCSDTDLDSDKCKSEEIQDDPVYTAPLASTCQSSHVVFLSDGEATSNTAKDRIKALTGADSCEDTDGDQSCGTELAEWLNETDHNLSLNGNQNISTHTIGFNFSGDFLPELAKAGGGSYYTAQSSEQLADVFESILGDVLAVDTTFVSPTATVNQYNRLTHRDELYFALFKPADTPRWTGNLKRYRLGSDSDANTAILDANGDPAVDEASGFFNSNSQSWWSDSVDGNLVEKGGAASQLQPTGADGTGKRRLFTFTGDSATLTTSGADLTTNDNALNEDNEAVTLDMLGLTSLAGDDSEKANYRESLLQWTRGIDVLDENEDESVTDNRQHMGDPMHSQPVILNYAASGSVTSNIYVATNEGFLHAFRETDGKEQFAFMPQELLKNLDAFYRNSPSTRHPYGLDGPMSTWVQDDNNNVVIDNGEKAYLYMGMRRGGNNYYALDVSDRLNPKLQWVIKGGPGGTPGFEELGESWSRPIPSTIMVNGTDRKVLMFAAGYDTNQDDDPSNLTAARTTDSTGRGLFIVDALSGDLIWSVLGTTGGNQRMDDMDYSIPSNLRAIDIDFDGRTDQLYVGDMGGRIWRFDITPFHQSGDLLSGGIIANLSGSGLVNERRFYYEPDVALIGRDGQRFLSISIGSGWRAHPLDELVNDRFFMIKSTDVYSAPDGYGKKTDGGGYEPLTADDLLDVTSTLDPGVNDHGWFMELTATGEKVLGESVTVDNQIVFTSYLPALELEACTTAIGGGAVYIVDVLDGSPTVDQDKDGNEELADRSTKLSIPAIPPSVAVMFSEDGPTGFAATQQIDLPVSNLTQRSFWIDHGAGQKAETIADSEDSE